MKYHLWTIGCQMNKADSWRAADELYSLGWQPAENPEDADLIVLNTCVVRRSAEDRVYGRLDSLKSLTRNRQRPWIVVMGCLVGENQPALERRFPFVDLFLRPSDIAGLVSFVQARGGPTHQRDLSPRREVPVCCYVPVMEGCDHHCTYCIVRLRRGKERSRPLIEIVEDVHGLVQRGAREVTLLGQNVDAYGHDLPGRPDLADLLSAVQRIDGLWRVRFLTSHPSEMSERIIDAVTELDKVCEHLELPVQAGHDLTLRRMARGYTVEQYHRLLSHIRERVPQVAVATDIIVGFPGEDEEHFQATCALVAEARFDVVHIAPYSVRPGTPAARLEDSVPQPEKERRRRLIEGMQEQIAGEINSRLLNSEVEVLVEERQGDKWRGRTRTNKLIFFPDDRDWEGRLATVQIEWAGPWSMQGQVKAPHPGKHPA